MSFSRIAQRLRRGLPGGRGLRLLPLWMQVHRHDLQRRLRRPVMLRPLVLGLLLCAATAHGAVVFSTDFEAGLPDEFTSPGATIEPVQGFAGLGTPGNQFAGSFLRYADGDLFDTALTLTDLPPHDTLTLGFLLAVIDSWDGTELLEVTVDDMVVFSHSFELATADTSSYVPPEGGLLSSGTDLGFSAGTFYQHDRAYDLSVEPAFTDIPHSADSVTIAWRVRAVPGGAASFWQGGADESWAIDDVTVEVVSGATTTTSTTTSTSTTTLPADECAGVPVGPTFRRSCAAWRPSSHACRRSTASAASSRSSLTRSSRGGTARPRPAISVRPTRRGRRRD